jgi:hypothetical protein
VLLTIFEKSQRVFGTRYVWSGACAEHRCVNPTPNSTGDLHLAQQGLQGLGNVCAHNGSCWVFPPRLSARSEFTGPVHVDGATTGNEEEEILDAVGQFGATTRNEVKVCDCPLGWWSARCHHLDLCVMEDANSRLSTSEPRCMHGELRPELT